MATVRLNYYCHKCETHIGHVTNFQCPLCRENFIEEVSPQHLSSQSVSSPTRPDPLIQFHQATPFSNTTIFIGGGAHPTADVNQYSNNVNVGTFLQTVMSQLAGGLIGGAGPQFPFVLQNGGAGGRFLDPTNIDAFLTQFLNQMGENSGPAPAPENRINAIPTVKVTADQEHDNLQCAICMDDFKRNDQAKRLPCSHHFHEDCISRWLRLHGTCPTCRVTLDGDNTSNREYYHFHPNQQSSSNNNRRNDDDNHGSSSNTDSAIPDFD